MKKLIEPRKHTSSNGLGHDNTTVRQAFVVEVQDVGKSRGHYLGFNRPAYTFRPEDVGMVLEVITAPGYISWYWGSVFPDVPNSVDLE